MKKSILIRLVLVLMLIAALLLTGFFLVRGTIRLSSLAKRGGETVADPMFAEATPSVTRPPEMDAEETQRPHGTLEDAEPREETPLSEG